MSYELWVILRWSVGLVKRSPTYETQPNLQSVDIRIPIP